MPSAPRRLVTAHWGLLIVCAAFLLAGALVLDDYGVSTDEWTQRLIGTAALDSLAGDGDQALDQLLKYSDRYYGPAFEAPLVLIERILGLEDSRDIFLSRHFLTHLLFLAGGAFCYLLVWRIFGSKPLALIAMSLFLLHPRLYAHSFINSKDLPFAAMFMIALYLTHRAFRRDTLAAFLICGVGIGILVNLRIVGLALFAAVLALRALDLALAGSGQARKRALLTGGAFALAVALTYYAVFPLLWPDPFGRFGEVWTVLGNHPEEKYNLFRGERLYGPDGPPLEYIPVWIGITTPPAVLLLATVGAAGLLWRTVRRPRDIWRATTLRFNLLLVALIVAPIIGIVAMSNNIYNDWRQVYFLYAPFALLAAMGLHWLLSCTERGWLRVGTWSLVGATIGVTLVSMGRIHPLENSYYNGLVDRTTPDLLVSRYHTGYWLQSSTQLLRKIIDDHPEQDILISEWGLSFASRGIPESIRSRIIRDDMILSTGFHSDHPVSNRAYTSRIYNNSLEIVRGRQVNTGDREAIIREALSGEPVARSFFTIYLHDDMIIFSREACVREDIERGLFFIDVVPRDTAVLSGNEKRSGRESLSIELGRLPIGGNGRCAWIFLLPPYPVASVSTGQYDETGEFWSVRVGITLPEVDAMVLAGEPLASGAFDIYRDDAELVYVKDPCMEDDIEAVFGMNVYPLDPGDLPADRKRDRFNALTFRFWDHGVRVGERCVAVVPLPGYPVAGVRTGQLDVTGWLWDVSFGVTPPEVDATVLAREPLARSVFDVYRDGDALVYIRDGCTEDEADATFLLHVVPVNVADLPADRVRHGFDNRDFEFWQRGGTRDGRCVAVVALPDYPIASVMTGQYGETGQLWDVSFGVTPLEVDASVLAREPLARSVFDVYRDGDALVYVRDGCTEDEASATFLLHVVPVDVADLPADRVQYGFDNRDFEFWWRGGMRDGRCVTVVALPDYPIASVVTGQYDETGQLWTVEFALPE